MQHGKQINRADKYYEIIESMARVLVEYGEGRKIAKLLGCTPKMVCEALSGKKDTPLARKIRKLAIDRGGVVKNNTYNK